MMSNAYPAPEPDHTPGERGDGPSVSSETGPLERDRVDGDQQPGEGTPPAHRHETGMVVHGNLRKRATREFGHATESELEAKPNTSTSKTIAPGAAFNPPRPPGTPAQNKLPPAPAKPQEPEPEPKPAERVAPIVHTQQADFGETGAVNDDSGVDIPPAGPDLDLGKYYSSQSLATVQTTAPAGSPRQPGERASTSQGEAEIVGFVDEDGDERPVTDLALRPAADAALQLANDPRNQAQDESTDAAAREPGKPRTSRLPLEGGVEPTDEEVDSIAKLETAEFTLPAELRRQIELARGGEVAAPPDAPDAEPAAEVDATPDATPEASAGRPPRTSESEADLATEPPDELADVSDAFVGDRADTRVRVAAMGARLVDGEIVRMDPPDEMADVSEAFVGDRGDTRVRINTSATPIIDGEPVASDAVISAVIPEDQVESEVPDAVAAEAEDDGGADPLIDVPDDLEPASGLIMDGTPVHSDASLPVVADSALAAASMNEKPEDTRARLQAKLQSLDTVDGGESDVQAPDHVSGESADDDDQARKELESGLHIVIEPASAKRTDEDTAAKATDAGDTLTDAEVDDYPTPVDPFPSPLHEQAQARAQAEVGDEEPLARFTTPSPAHIPTPAGHREMTPAPAAAPPHARTMTPHGPKPPAPSRVTTPAGLPSHTSSSSLPVVEEQLAHDPTETPAPDMFRRTPEMRRRTGEIVVLPDKAPKDLPFVAPVVANRGETEQLRKQLDEQGNEPQRMTPSSEIRTLGASSSEISTLDVPLSPIEEAHRLLGGYETVELDAVVETPEEELERLRQEVTTLKKTHRRVRDALARAKTFQMQMMPEPPTDVTGIEFGVCYKAAEQVSGDFYDFVRMPDGKWGITIGDSAGHGIAPALVMTVTRKLLSVFLHEGNGPAAALRKTNAYIFSDIPQATFITAIAGVLDPKAGTFRFARAGHPSMLVFRDAKEEPEQFMPNGMALGMDQGALFDLTLTEEEITLNPHDLVVLYTDGAFETTNRQKERFGMDRFIMTLREFGGGAMPYLMKKLNSVIQRYRAGSRQDDDMSVIGLRVLGGDGNTNPAKMWRTSQQRRGTSRADGIADYS